MGKTVNLEKILFATAFAVNTKKIQENENPVEALTAHKTRQLLDMVMRIDEIKRPWQTIKHSKDVHEYKMALYVFTPEELNQWRQNIVDQTKKGLLK